MRVLAALILALALAPGAVALGVPRVEVPSAAPALVAEAAEELPLAPLPASAPTAVVEALDAAAPVVAVVQPVLALAEPAPTLRVTEPVLTPADLAAIAAVVEPAVPAAPAPVPEPYLFPRDEPGPLLDVAAPAPAAEGPAPPTVPSAAAPAALSPGLPAEAAGFAALLLALGLYVRLAPGAALESPTRRRVLEAVRADPGCTVNTVARALGVDYKTAQHHLRVLRRSGFLHGERVGGWERYFVAGALPHEGHAAAVVLRAPAARALAAALAEGSRARASELARSLGVSEATASVQLRRLAAAGLVQRGADGLWVAA